MRIILCCENGGAKIIAPVKSRCLVVRINAPSLREIIGTLEEVAKREQLGQLPDEFLEFIANAAGGNLRRALLMLEAAKAKATSMSVPLRQLKHAEIPLADWEVAVKDVAFMMIEEQSTGNLLKIRSKLYELLSHCIPATVILAGLVKALLASVDQELKVELFADAAHYDCCIQQGQKAIFHLEAFVAKFMCSYKKFIGQMIIE
jgi:replication factor C subunit 3/5